MHRVEPKHFPKLSDLLGIKTTDDPKAKPPVSAPKDPVGRDLMASLMSGIPSIIQKKPETEQPVGQESADGD